MGDDRILVFCPTARLELETLQALTAQTYAGRLDALLTRDNPYAAPFANILYNYQKMRTVMLAGEYAAVWIIESDVIPPADALARLLADPGDTVGGVYALRHGEPQPNLYKRAQGGLTPWTWEDVAAMTPHVVDVDGASLGCLLVRRHVLARVRFRAGGTNACDWAFMQDVGAVGFRQTADLSLRCGHKRPDGVILWVGDTGVEYTRPGSDAAALYVTEGASFVPGIPARDLSTLDWDALTPDQRRRAMAARVYALPRDPHAYGSGQGA